MRTTREPILQRLCVRPALLRGLAAVLSLASSFACADSVTGPGASSAARIQLDPSTVTAVSLGETIQFNARVLDEGGALLSRIALTWTSSDTTILVSEGNGRFRAKTNGNASVTVGLTNDDHLPKQTAQIVVHQEAAQIISTSDTLKLFAIGQTITVQAHVKDALGNDLVGSAAPTWRSANAAVATVDSAGNVTAKSDGEMLITLQSGQLSKSFFTRVSAIVRVSGCVSSADAVGPEKCSGVPLTVRR
ncbi:MAG TPA: Ig-like domain-containing protein [Gemmatimonadaceae bacterium]|nr:Ig-like domain-containing protein [Gemmatimonadaceae bacterium]